MVWAPYLAIWLSPVYAQGSFQVRLAEPFSVLVIELRLTAYQARGTYPLLSFHSPINSFLSLLLLFPRFWGILVLEIPRNTLKFIIEPVSFSRDRYCLHSLPSLSCGSCRVWFVFFNVFFFENWISSSSVWKH